MKIAIIGAGVVGVATAYEMCREGYAVTVFEQRSAAAEEASFATGGHLGPVALLPWAIPRYTKEAKIFGSQSTVRLASGWKRSDLSWLSRWRKSAKSDGPMAQALQNLSQYSCDRLSTIATEHLLDFEASQGRLVLFRTELQQALWTPVAEHLAASGVRLNKVDAEQARAIEPGLCTDYPFIGGYHLPDALAGNCRLLAHLVRSGIQEAGVQWRWNTTVKRLSKTRVGLYVQNDPQLHRFDHIVICAGASSAALLQPFGVQLPVANLYGYSVSAPLREPSHAPQASLLDAHEQMTITRLGQRVRITGGAELGGATDAPHHAPTLQKLYRTLQDWFPGGAQLSTGVQIWRGCRSTLSDGAPVISAGGPPCVWINAGHASAGWALAFGSARAITAMVSNRPPEINVNPFSLKRFGS